MGDIHLRTLMLLLVSTLFCVDRSEPLFFFAASLVSSSIESYSSKAAVTGRVIKLHSGVTENLTRRLPGERPLSRRRAVSLDGRGGDPR